MLHLHCTGSAVKTWTVLRRHGDVPLAASAHFTAELKFRVLEVDPSTGEVEGDDEGFAEEYPLEDIELITADFIAKVCQHQAFVERDHALGKCDRLPSGLGRCQRQ